MRERNALEMQSKSSAAEKVGHVALLSIVIPHWPIDEEVDEALKTCVASLPADSEKIVVVNEGTGFGRNVNIGLRLATGDYVAVVTNDSRIVEGDMHDLCVPGVVTSPVVLEKPGIEPGGFHGAFWVAPREVIDRVGLLDERFEGAFFEDDDYLERLRQAEIPTRQIASVHVWSRRIGLTMSKLPDRGKGWLSENERRFEEKWGWVPPPTDPGD
jgi:glycosyltransferase involved in cell wall biosynthesis